MSQTLEILKKARELISDPNAWIQGDYAADNEGNFVPVNNSRAQKFCAVGALTKAAVLYEGAAVSMVRSTSIAKVLTENANESHLPTFNDTSTHKQVLDLFDKAITRLEKEQVNVI